MNTYVLSILNYILICFECVMSSYLAGSFFQRKFSHAVHVFAVSILFVLCIIYLRLFGYSIPLKLIVGILLHMIWIKTVFVSKNVNALFVAFFLMSFWTVFDTLCLFSVSVLLKVDYRNLIDMPFLYLLICFAIKIFELLGIVVICTFVKRHEKIWSMHWIDWLRILFFPICSLVIAFELMHIYYKAPALAPTLTLCTCILLVSDVMAVFLLDHLENQQVAIRNNVILQQDLKAERESINSWAKAYREERKRSHDFQNQLSVLRGMLDDHVPPETFKEYFDSLLNIELPKSRYINTNRPVADVLISQKAAIAGSKDIDFRIQLDDLSLLPLTDDELVVVLANLLDNAIAATEKIADKSLRRMLIKVQCTPEVSYLYIENPTAEPVNIRNNRVAVQQNECSGHGFGIQNVTTILDRRHALYAFEYHADESRFSFSAQIME